jgi:hypothetical protein
VAERVAALHVLQGEARDELGGQDRLLEDLDRLADAHDPQLGVALVQPGLHALGVGVDHEDGVARADLGLGVAAERAGQAVADATPLVARVGREERDLACAGRRRIAVDGHARAVGAAVVELREHRAEVLAEVLADHRRLREEADDSTHGRRF